jgi:uncharacterized protein YegL
MIDCCGEMCGEKIGIINNSLQICLADLNCMAEEHKDTELLIRVMSYGTGASWKNDKAISVADFVWEDLEAAGVCDMGKAFELLSAEFEQMDNTIESQMTPVVVFLASWRATDNVEPAIDRFNNTAWSKKAVKIAITIGKDADTETLEKFTGDKGRIIPANQIFQLQEWLIWDTVEIYPCTEIKKSREEVLLCDIVKNYPEILENPKKLKTVLMDYYPEDKLLQNLILACVEEGIINEMIEMEKCSIADAYRYAKMVVSAHGCTIEKAQETVELWIEALNIFSEGKEHI